MSTVDLTKDTFRETYENNDIVVIDFWASWCAPCQSFAPTYERVSKKFPQVTFGKVNTETEPELSTYFSIRSIPTLVVIREGLELFCEPGALDEKTLENLVQQAVDADMTEIKKKLAAEDEPQPADTE